MNKDDENGMLRSTEEKREIAPGLFNHVFSRMNSRYPFHWIVLAQLIFVWLYVSHDFSEFFSCIYDDYLSFIKLNSGENFSYPLYKAYTVTQIFLIPIQAVFLVVGSDEQIIDLMNKKNKNIFIFGNALVSVLLVLFFELGHYGLLRPFGVNIISAVFTPIVTAYIGYSIAVLVLYFIENQ